MNYYLTLAFSLFLYMNMWFVVSIIKKRNDIADMAWGLGFVLLSWLAFFINQGFHPTAILLNLLVTVWGLRLFLHIYGRNKNKPEDYRYRQWRNDWGKFFFVRSYLQVFMLQGMLLFLIALPVFFINSSPSNGNFTLQSAGVIVWLTGFYFEVVGDAQLAAFIKNPDNRGKLMRTGLWKFTRHPNYFGEVTMWWGIFTIALSYSGGLFTIIGPLTITILILFVSGIPLLENKYRGRADFEEYKKKTSIFFPWPPRK